MSRNEPKVLIASPIHQKPAILREFLHSLLELQCHADYYFIDDNKDYRSKQLLTMFQTLKKGQSLVIIEPSPYKDDYIKNETRHFWNNHLIWKVAKFKDNIINYARDHDYDYVFLVDSDLLLHPLTITKLIEAEKDIVSEIFWTKWNEGSIEEPQVWLRDEYTQTTEEFKGSDGEKYEAIMAFYRSLRIPGVYKVGGLGACTLISKKAIQAGVGFEKLYNLSFWGEDRHFCIRAVALGFELFVETTYPAYHIYREANLSGIDEFKKANGYKHIEEHPIVIPKGRSLTLSMIVKDEAEKFLREVLEHAKQYVDYAVIVDDGSTDNTKDIIKDVLSGFPHTLIENKESKFHHEFELRKQQWEAVIATNPEWIINLDADEIFEDNIMIAIRDIINDEGVYLYSFRLYDFWNENEYREDTFWKAHQYYRPFLLRYVPDYTYTWKETNQHCGRFPDNIFQLPNRVSSLRVKHLGWSREGIRLEKYKRYKQLDPEGKFGNLAQYESILDSQPHLIKWED